MTTTIENRPGELWAILPEALSARVELLRAWEPGARAGGAGAAVVVTYAAGGVAVLEISGTLVHQVQRLEDVSYDAIIAALRQPVKNPEVKNIVLRINSPGGTVAGVDGAVDAVAQAAKQKPVFAYSDATLCSAAYWLASPTRAIGAARTAQVGSVGVVAVHVDRSAAMDRAGVKVSYITSGRYKAMGNPDEPLGDEARRYLKERIDAAYQLFVSEVAAGRGLSVGDAASWADGRVFPAGEAKAAGLLNHVLGWQEFLTLVTSGAMPARSSSSAHASRLAAGPGDWDRDPALRAEFGGDRARYEAYVSATASGRARIVTGPRAIAGRPL